MAPVGGGVEDDIIGTAFDAAFQHGLERLVGRVVAVERQVVAEHDEAVGRVAQQGHQVGQVLDVLAMNLDQLETPGLIAGGGIDCGMGCLHQRRFAHAPGSPEQRVVGGQSAGEPFGILDQNVADPVDITDALLSEDQTSLLLMFDEIQQKGFEGDTFLGGLSQHFRDLLMCRNEETLPLLEVSEGLQERYRAQSAYTPEDMLLTNLNIANQAAVQYGYSKNKRLLVELAILKMCYQRQAIEGSELESKKKDSP